MVVSFSRLDLLPKGISQGISGQETMGLVGPFWKFSRTNFEYSTAPLKAGQSRSEDDFPKMLYKDWSHGTMDSVLALNAADLCLIPNIIYGPSQSCQE